MKSSTVNLLNFLSRKLTRFIIIPIDTRRRNRYLLEIISLEIRLKLENSKIIDSLIIFIWESDIFKLNYIQRK